MIHRVVSAIKRCIVAWLPQRIVQVPVRELVLMSDRIKGLCILIVGGTLRIGLTICMAD